MSTTIGTLKEFSLHASVKQLYSRPGDLLDAKVDNSIIDIVRSDIFVEIQTGHFIGLKGKLEKHLGQTAYSCGVSNFVRQTNNAHSQ